MGSIRAAIALFPDSKQLTTSSARLLAWQLARLAMNLGRRPIELVHQLAVRALEMVHCAVRAQQ
eukprot:12587351-Alexandrium_andersonii.AAC.1